MTWPVQPLRAAVLLFAALAAASCRPGGDPPPAGAQAPPSPPPAVPADPPANFTVNISNQSSDLDPARIRVYLDGEKVVDGAFFWATPENPVFGGHTVSSHPFRLDPGAHRIRVEVLNVEESVEEAFVLDGPLFANFLFWFELEEGKVVEKKLELRIEKRGLALY